MNSFLKKLITNTFLRDNMNYDEIHQLFNVPPGSGPSVIQYDEQQLMGTNIVEDAETDADRIYCAIVESDSRENLQIKKEKVQNMIKVEIL
jgi:hypothetical protein